MKDLGPLQKSVWEKIQKAVSSSAAEKLPRLSAIASEMDKAWERWHAILNENGSGFPPNGHEVGVSPEPSAGAPSMREDEDYTGRSIRAVSFKGRALPVSNFKDLLLEFIGILQERHPTDFDRVAVSVKGRNPYFSPDPSELRISKKLPRGSLFVETNLNANLIVEICRRLAHAFGHDPGDLRIEKSPIRTRAVKGTRI